MRSSKPTQVFFRSVFGLMLLGIPTIAQDIQEQPDTKIPIVIRSGSAEDASRDSKSFLRQILRTVCTSKDRTLCENQITSLREDEIEVVDSRGTPLYLVWFRTPYKRIEEESGSGLETGEIPDEEKVAVQCCAQAAPGFFSYARNGLDNPIDINLATIALYRKHFLIKKKARSFEISPDSNSQKGKVETLFGVPW